MKVYHNSRSLDYRRPFGAVTVGTAVTFSIDIEGAVPENVRLAIRKDDSGAPQFIDMKETAGAYDSETSYIRKRFTASFTVPDTGCLIWYYFAIELEHEDERLILYYGNNKENLGGEGEVYKTDPAPYQITVYKEAKVPSWYKDGIVYQIFPDRFARDEDWEERCEKAVSRINGRPAGETRLIEEDWNRAAYYIRNEENRVTGWPIYGGSFKGIEDKLDYLKSLGVTAIYLNPIFESTSNHRYDTADYMSPDPALGTSEEFSHFAEQAGERGIRIILDGVFSHTGADSVYFDRFGNYCDIRSLEDTDIECGEVMPDGRIAACASGAYADEDSPYRSWYKFDSNEECGYKSWWGVDDLPEVNEEDPAFRELITGEEGVLQHWMDLGVSGWRLDVADELPDEFIRDIRTRIKSEDPDGLIIGEVWEDASNKISYGERRKYFMGDELDGVMNYPVRSMLLDYVNYTISSSHAARMLESLEENYPRENFYGGLNLIGSHDRERIITAMAAAEDYKSAVSKVRLMSTLQFTLPGVPCIYYGDEVGLTGGVDPENRNGYPWGYENLDLGYHYRMLGLIYDEHPVLKNGGFTMLSGRYGISDDVFAFIRSGNSGDDVCEKILVLANRSYGPADVDLTEVPEAAGGYALELLTSTEMEAGKEGLGEIIHMEPLSCRIILIMDEPPEKESFTRSAGVICHISSTGEGVLGTPAKEFVDYIASAGMSVWQVLPLNPTGLGDSPYFSEAAFAGNPEFINRDELPGNDEYVEFCRNNMDWLSGYAAYTVIGEITGSRNWAEWPEEYKNGDPEDLLKILSEEHGARIEELVKDQYYFYVQWKDLKKYANERGISLMGDLPVYTAGGSADVWANKEIFRLDENGRLKVHAGVPPDAFSDLGQDWGNPLYDWEYLRDHGYEWWMKRLRQCAERYDILRLDHFRGFSEYFAIPYGCKPAKGYWQHSAGIDFFRKLKKRLAEEGYTMKILAEDLGYLDAGVKNLLKLSGLPGMDIWQFTAEEMTAMKEEEASYRAFYTGTHDNDTIAGYVKKKLQPEKEDDDTVSDEDAEKLETETEIEALSIFKKIYESPAPLAILQLQDMFLLGSEARMNVPGVAEGNWKWKIPGKDIHEAFDDADERAAWFRELAEKTRRI